MYARSASGDLYVLETRGSKVKSLDTEFSRGQIRPVRDPKGHESAFDVNGEHDFPEQETLNDKGEVLDLHLGVE